jgi:RNA polymerase-interacting CarD/CdnL/TRCF family regulator
MYHLIKKVLYPFVSVFALVALVAGLFSFATPAYASTGTTTTPPTATEKDLMARYKSEQAWLVTQQANLDKTAAVITKVQALITKANAAGEDTTALVAALAIFESQVATAENSHTTASAILAAHDGFDDSGNVTNVLAARLTVDDSHQALAICHDVLVQAGNDLSKALSDWKKIEKIKDIRALLKKDYQIEQNWLVKQQDNLNKTASVVTNVQNLITKANAKGKDTTALVNALAVFQSQIAIAQSSHNTAAGILATHNGFDAKGNVIDRDAARLTVDSARQSLSDAHNLLWQAANDLHQAIKEWRENNK